MPTVRSVRLRRRSGPASPGRLVGVAATLLAAALAAAPLTAAEPPAFPLKVDPSGRFLADQRGTPFLVHGDTPWSLTHNLTLEEAVRYLDDRRARGFNSLLVSAPDAYDPEGKATYPPDRYGNQPFESGDWTRPVEAYWAHVDRVLKKAAEDVRAYPYRAILSGAAGHLFGNKPLWYCGRGWEAALALPGSRYMEIARRFFDSRRWWELEPDITHEVVVDGRGDPGGDDGAQVAVARGGDALVAYVPSRLTLKVRLDRLSGPALRGFWFDPRTGTATAIGTFPREGVRSFQPPRDGDWLLVLDDASKGRPAPGAAAAP